MNDSNPFENYFQNYVEQKAKKIINNLFSTIISSSAMTGGAFSFLPYWVVISPQNGVQEMIQTFLMNDL